MQEGGSSKSERTAIDRAAPMGNATTRTLERVAAAMGLLHTAPIVFEPAKDIPCGGVLLAVPALLAMGLLERSLEMYSLPKGYYGLSSILLLLAMLALARLKSVEQLRYVAPGEWGNLLGLDRIPEVRTLRAKLELLCRQAGRAAEWNTELAKRWMGLEPESEPIFYVDGHVRVYHGKKAHLPRHFVPRQKLLLRAAVDYWVNAMDGQPFVYLNQEIDHGLVQALREDVIPWVEANTTVSREHQRRMDEDPEQPRFTVVFDREGYSPNLFEELQKRRIAVLSYHRYPKEEWKEEEFRNYTVKLVNGESVEMRLAERETVLSQGMTIREVRKWDRGGGQVSMVTTHRRMEIAALAGSLFARWSQENFFRYMRQHYAIDGLVEYGSETISDTEVTVNPRWRVLYNAIRKQHGVLRKERSRFAAVTLTEPLSPVEVERYELTQALQQEKIAKIVSELNELKKERKATKHHIPVKDLPEGERYTRLPAERKHFVDTIKMIAYRAETSMVSILREKLARSEDGRSLVQQIFQNEVDLIPDPEAQTLTVRLHHLTQAAHDEAALHLCQQLNETETLFPGTQLRMVFQIGGSS